MQQKRTTVAQAQDQVLAHHINIQKAEEEEKKEITGMATEIALKAVADIT